MNFSILKVCVRGPGQKTVFLKISKKTLAESIVFVGFFLCEPDAVSASLRPGYNDVKPKIVIKKDKKKA